jgi:hypothetical protein
MTARLEKLVISDWHTASELARLKLRGLPKTKMGILNLIDREGWATRGQKLARRRNGRGGGWEYHINNLPAPSRHHLAIKRHKTLVPEDIEVLIPETEPEDFTKTQSIRRDARLEILGLFDVFHSNCNLALRTAEFEFARAWNAGAIKAPGWVLAEIRTVSAPSLQRWRKARDSGQLHDLGGKYKRGKKSVLARSHGGEVALFIGALIAKQPHLTADHIRDIVRDRFDDTVIFTDTGETRPMPPIRAFQRFIANWKAENRTALMKITNPDKYKSVARFSGRNMNAHVIRLNQLWEIDASPSDVMTLDGRMNVYVVIDIFSRRMMVLVSRTPRTAAMLSLLRLAIIEWACPKSCARITGLISRPMKQGGR